MKRSRAIFCPARVVGGGEDHECARREVYVVTGANSGIGFNAAQRFAEQGAEVVLVCRSLDKGRAAQARIIASAGHDRVRLEIADFSSMQSVSALADRLAEQYSEIHVLCNNAGSANASRQLTADGFEQTFAVNHLSGFLLTRKLMPSLLACQSGPARVVLPAHWGTGTALSILMIWS